MWLLALVFVKWTYFCNEVHMHRKGRQMYAYYLYMHIAPHNWEVISLASQLGVHFTLWECFENYSLFLSCLRRFSSRKSCAILLWILLWALFSSHCFCCLFLPIMCVFSPSSFLLQFYLLTWSCWHLSVIFQFPLLGQHYTDIRMGKN